MNTEHFFSHFSLKLVIFISNEFILFPFKFIDLFKEGNYNNPSPNDIFSSKDLEYT